MQHGHKRQHCAAVKAAQEKAGSARAQYAQADQEEEPEPFGSQESVYQTMAEEDGYEDVEDEQWYTDEEEVEEDVDVYMVSVHDSDLPTIPLTSPECQKYVEELRTAEFWDGLPSQEQDKCFQAEVVEGIPNGRIPRAPRTRELITQDMMVDGVSFKVLMDTGAAVSLIPRWAFLKLLDIKGLEFYSGKISQSELRIRGVTDHLLFSVQEVVLRFDTGSTQTDVPCLIDESGDRTESGTPPDSGWKWNGFSRCGSSEPPGTTLQRPPLARLGMECCAE